MRDSTPSRHRRLFLRTAAATLAALASPLAARAGGKALRLLVGFPPGGGTDAIARILAEALKEELGVAVTVDNRPGAGGQLAVQALRSAAADGATFLLSHDHTVSILPLVMKDPGFDPSRDLSPAVGFATFANAWAVSAGTPAKSLDAYAAWARVQPRDRGMVGIPAPASVPEFLVQAVARKHRLDLEAAPYRGSAPMIADMLGGRLAAGVASVPDLMENHRAGRLDVVAVLGPARQPALPDVPTFGELGMPGFEDLPYYGFFAPAGTPAAAIEDFSGAVARVIAKPAVRARLTSMGLAVEHLAAPQLAERERAYRQAWARIIQASGFVPR